MCPLWPFHVFFMYAMLLAPLWILSSTVAAEVASRTSSWGVSFDPKKVVGLPIGDMQTVRFSTSGLTKEEVQVGVVSVLTDDDDYIVAQPEPLDRTYVLREENITDGNWSSAFNVTANFLGLAKMRLRLSNNYSGDVIRESDFLSVTVVRPVRFVDKMFTYSVAILVSVIYINFGCALDWVVFKKTIRRPIGPIIGFISQFLFMPLISYGLGKVLFPKNAAMQLGMFFTGVSPAGGASNIWTYLLEGNLNLSITMTTISTFAAFGMMPIWIFSLGRLIFEEAQLGVPYDRNAAFTIGLVIPLAIGFLIQKYLPRVCKIMVRILKPFSALLILFIIIFAIATNVYLFKLFTWQIIVAGLGLPWLGYTCGMLMARVCKQPPDDILAISIETGIQNTGIAIFLLRFSLGQPEADLTTVVPVAVAIMTPIPLVMLLIYRKCRYRGEEKRRLRLSSREEEKDISGAVSTNNGESLAHLDVTSIK